MKTSIVIPTYDGLRLLRTCIESIRLHTCPNEYEIIVVDNASTDGTLEWLDPQEDIRLIRNGENKGFPAACNQGLEAASGDYLLLLNNDTVVTPRWLTQLLACLDSDSRIGAVGPMTNASSYHCVVSATYDTMKEMTAFADKYNRPDPSKWIERLKLIAFCLLLKREVFETVGALDEEYAPGNFEDDDYCLRIRGAGYKLVLCGDTFIHHEGNATFGRDADAFSRSLEKNSGIFKRKWGFDPRYSFSIRYDLLTWMDEPRNRRLRVLEVGCACGGTLLEIRNHYPHAEVYGVELNPHAAAVAATVSRTVAANIETVNLDFPDESFDYIVLGDVLEHLQDPWSTLNRMNRLLKPGGKVLAGIPNVAHISVIRDLIQGRWNYTDRGLLDITHFRFFTLESIRQLFAGSGFPNPEFKRVQPAPAPDDEEWMARLAAMWGEEWKPHWMTYQYLIRADKAGVAYMVFKRALRRLEWGVDPETSEREIVSLWEQGKMTDADVIRYFERDSGNPDEAARLLDAILDTPEGSP